MRLKHIISDEPRNMISLDYSVVSGPIENCSFGIICFKKSFKMIIIKFFLTFF